MQSVPEFPISALLVTAVGSVLLAAAKKAKLLKLQAYSTYAPIQSRTYTNTSTYGS